MGSYFALKKREALINIGMIYLEAVSDLVKDLRKLSREKIWKIIQEIISSLESQSRIIRISRTGQDFLHELEGE